VAEYIHEPLNAGLKDNSPYVRKTAVMGVLKMYTLNSEFVTEGDIIDTLYDMLKDRDTQVVTNCIHALNEIMTDEGGMAINAQIIQHLLNRIMEFNEWGQCTVLELVAHYKPGDQQETFNIMNLLEQCLRVSNSAVVLGATKCFLFLTEDMPELKNQIYQRLKAPLLTLMAGSSPEVAFSVLHHVQILVERGPGIFDDEHRQFYTRYNEPTNVKYIKIDIMSKVVNESNLNELMAELSEYVVDVDAELSRRAIRSIGNIATRLPASSQRILDQLMEFIEMDIDWVRSESVIVLKNLLRKHPEARHDVLPMLKTCLKKVDEEEAKCSVIWMLGEFGESRTVSHSRTLSHCWASSASLSLSLTAGRQDWWASSASQGESERVSK
jgi:AP-4 complex subunit beta-1